MCLKKNCVRNFFKGMFLVLLGVISFSLLLPPTQASAADKNYKITILGGSAGGVWSVITEGVAESIRRGIPDAQLTTEPGKDGPNQVMVSKNEVQFAITYDATNYAAVNAMNPYKKSLPNLRTAAVLNPTGAFQFIIDEKTGITSFGDIAKKKYPLRLSANRKGTLMHLSGETVLEAYGITVDKLNSWKGKVYYIPSKQAVSLWDAGQLDAAQEVAQFPMSRYLEHGQKHQLRMLSVDKEKLAVLGKKLGMSPITIPAKTYSWQKEDCVTLNTKLMLLTSADQSDKMVYDVVKAIYQGLDYLHKVHANLRELTPQIMANDVMVKLHPGAAKFYKEIGVIK
ncbi:TAXI family TRAP transporter solute-binding subunit [Desulfobacula sp.]|uniref:TAXI family TRAP transporter solute-binding subunit n=1 Tax=Desulfobacula sp. TaxID=2593537 RepID=UPI002610F0B4|nr:TAXI family TRAP transporter solute-binding subunit [Desulfobacula sp.]